MQAKAWHPIPTRVLRAARLGRGWSYETTARAFGVSSKTWERYEKAGQVPLDIVGDVIRVLTLDVEPPIYARLRSVPSPEGVSPSTGEVLAIIRETADVVGQLVVALRVLSERLGQPVDDDPAAPLAPGGAARPR